ncbi:type VI secretion system contractile sheath small subunit [Francisella adeliensis]|uniref:Type VI secretion system contractile sheath small subunit n=1 Tax=Francisella adeliensis TaxID=2007306 RepID=A0A2Z4XWB4_9GAMM|nr:type VI secretion system contractile sheath small subunit [Francisella adeliensis]AXA32989.1 type VI secretion system-associated protein [Francisella adeliensis]MBK2086126.1 type VI secretion system contractile sheath small subunit [Francisella adeliensis]MBK2096710.1 type VI secretion system contractile sheath small subunit [Francisella adeliensis]QIW11215.1 type VI secretion system contractile sheath small subunit [Francisella adeliensis]QIW13091.1 type VI secretion system contractile she
MARKTIPKSRLMINYETTVDGILKKKELPYKVLVAGDFSKGKSKDAEQELADREIRKVDNGVDRAMRDMDISLNFEVPNFVSKQSNNINVNYKLEAVKDFKPDAVAQKVPEIKALLQLKEILSSFAKDIDNNRNLKKTIDSVFSDKDELDVLKKKIPNLANYSIENDDSATEEKN